MNEQERTRTEQYESYLSATHKLGRALTVLVLALLRYLTLPGVSVALVLLPA